MVLSSGGSGLPPEENTTHPNHGMKNFFLFLAKLLLFCILAGGGYIAYEAHRFLSTPASQTPEDVIISIAPGSTFDRVAWDLKKAGAITDVDRFRLLARLKEALGKVKAGDFLVNTGWTPERVLLQITEGKAVLYRLSLREGLTWWETARAVEAQGFATYEDFKAVIHDPDFLKEFNIPFANAEGFLFPETYLMKKPRNPLDREQAREVAATMVRMFWTKAEPLWKTLPPESEPATPGAMQSPPAEQVPVQPPTQPTTQSLGATVPEEPDSDRSKTDALLPPVPAAETETEGGTASGTTGSGGALPRIASAPPAQGEEQTSGGRDRSLPDAGAVSQDAAGGKDMAPQTAAVAASTDGAVNAAPPAAAPSVASSSPPEPAPARQGGPQLPADVGPQALRRLIILASLVEKETGVPSERALVAGVYANRLRLGMLLQCDPTIIYGIGENFTGSIRRSQIADPQNPYNTYQHPGLPPGPICSSGLDALKAAADPLQHEYLYFVATGIDGGHTFSKSLSEHNKAVQIYRARMRGQK